MSNFDMVSSRVVFRPIVGIICFAWTPKKFELLLAFSVAEPMETHVHSFCTFWLYFSIDNCISHGIVGLDGGRRLCMSHFFENDADVNCFSGHDVQGGEFSFRG